MASLNQVEQTSLNGSDKEFPTQEDAAAEQPFRAAERRLSEALLDLSEEDSLKELEPHEYHVYSGWDEAVRGWARVAPMSCILLTQKQYGKAKHKEADNPSPSSAADPSAPNTEGSASTAEHCPEPHVGTPNSLKKSKQLNQHTASRKNTASVALHKEASEGPVPNAVQKTSSNLTLGEKLEAEVTLRETPHLSPKCSVSEYKPTKPQKHSSRPNNTVVPIRNFTFLPPIKSNLHTFGGELCIDKKGPEGESIEVNCFMLQKKSGTRVTKADHVTHQVLASSNSTGLTSKHQTCQHNPPLFSAVRVSIPSIPRRYQVPSTPDTVHRTHYSISKGLTQALHSNSAAGAQAHMHLGETLHASRLYEGCEINV